MISDLFPPAKRGPPVGVYTMSAALGSGLALVLGGAVIHFVATADALTLPLVGAMRPWQATFLVVGTAGLVLLPLLATIPERTTALERATPGQGLGAFLREHRAFYVRHYVSIGIYSALAYAVLTWTPSLFIRVHEMAAPEVGLQYGAILLLCGGFGPVVAGALAARLVRRGVSAASVKIVAASIVILIPCTIVAGLSPAPRLALLVLIPGSLALTAPMGGAMLALQEVTPNRLRGRISALYYVFSSIVRLSVGPLSVALFSDYVFHDPKSVGTAIAIVAVLLGPVSAWLLYGRRHQYAVLARSIAADGDGGLASDERRVGDVRAAPVPAAALD